MSFALFYLRSAWVSFAVVTATILPGRAQVTIELQNSSNAADHYLCWSPVQGRAKLTSTSGAPVEIRVTSIASPTGGALHFQRDGAQRPTPSTFQPQSEIIIT